MVDSRLREANHLREQRRQAQEESTPQVEEPVDDGQQQEYGQQEYDDEDWDAAIEDEDDICMNDYKQQQAA